MSEDIIILMISVSILLGTIGLIALLWAVKTGQFDDQAKFVDAAHFDNEEDLQAAIKLEEKKRIRREEREAREDYRPPD
jgi:cbb3-type cytochrome oxidase maturation protein